VRFASANDLDVGRSVDEVLRVLDGLQTDELCPCNWKKGEETITQALKKAV
jgi:alkyl hydroperoxide reductase subunit AhpC